MRTSRRAGRSDSSGLVARAERSDGQRGKPWESSAVKASELAVRLVSVLRRLGGVPFVRPLPNGPHSAEV